MLEVIEDHDPQAPFELRIIMSPNRSLDWQQNKKVIWSLGALCGGIAMAFSLVTGLWIMLPFAGLEIAALAGALYFVSWKLSYRHVITFKGDQIIIEKGVYRPRGRWVWSKRATHLQSKPAQHPWEAGKLSLHNPPDTVNIGDFLSIDDTAEVIARIREQILYRPQTS